MAKPDTRRTGRHHRLAAHTATPRWQLRARPGRRVDDHGQHLAGAQRRRHRFSQRRNHRHTSGQLPAGPTRAERPLGLGPGHDGPGLRGRAALHRQRPGHRGIGARLPCRRAKPGRLLGRRSLRDRARAARTARGRPNPAEPDTSGHQAPIRRCPHRHRHPRGDPERHRPQRHRCKH